MRRVLWISLWLMGCGRLGFGPSDPGVSPDGAPPQIDAPGGDAVSARCNPTKPFGTPAALVTLNSDSDEGGLTLTDDGLHAMFWSARNGRLQIWQTKRSIGDLFDAPTEVGELDSGLDDDTPSLSGDGKTIVFSSTRDLGGGGSGSGTTDWNLWKARRASVSDAFDTPEPVADANDGGDNHGSSFVSSADALYHSTNGDLYVVNNAVVPLAAQAAANLPLDTLNTGDSETAPVVTADQRVIFFARTAGSGACDVMYSERASEAQPFPAPQPLEGVNSTDDDDIPAWISSDQCELYLSKKGATSMDLYVARRPL